MNSEVLLHLREGGKWRRNHRDTGSDRQKYSKNKKQVRKAKTEPQLQKGEKYRKGGK
jgi:hypothetical protein